MNWVNLLTRLIPIALQVAPLIENLIGSSSGEEKREAAIEMIVPGIRAAEAAAGRDLVDEELLADAAGKAVDSAVTILNEVGVLGKESVGAGDGDLG
jgi:hypothetical protein